MPNAVEIKNVSKRYNINHQQGGYIALRDVLANIFKHPMRFAKKKVGGAFKPKEEFWALKDINLSVKKGEAIGIIGPNGAGKSTLLKILSQITPPTTGQIKMMGKVASMLEVGTGFHPELTGRENVFLNGAILGMSRIEIGQKFDSIVKFAGVEKFIDTPVKHYSSGMQVRLAFAVAAHLEPDILIIDEVLAVGDAQFQKKSLSKMEEVTRNQQRTILFVSHNMDAVQKLCTRTIVLHEGKILLEGPTDKIISQYLEQKMDHVAERIWEPDKAPGDDVVRMRAMRALDQTGQISKQFDVRDPVNIEVEYEVFQPAHRLMLQLYFFNELSHVIFISNNNLDAPWQDGEHPVGRFRSVCQIPGDFLNESIISVAYRMINPDLAQMIHATEPEALKFQIDDRLDPEGVRGNFKLPWRLDGVRPRIPWKIDQLS
ncbi:MAG: polysaccharide ABC transporter ATP-binding protein [bacterium]|nr:polysaccharide ABC transporter ATP-binding protein [bacterium]